MQLFPASIYWKQIVVKDLPAKASYKLLRDVTSYRTEARCVHFCSCLPTIAFWFTIIPLSTDSISIFLTTLSKKESVRLSVITSMSCLMIVIWMLPNFCYYWRICVDVPSHNSVSIHLSPRWFKIVVTAPDIFLAETHTHAGIDFLAALHSTFWNQPKIDCSADLSLLWEKGTYWTLDKRPPDELDVLPNVWSEFCGAFRETSGILFILRLRRIWGEMRGRGQENFDVNHKYLHRIEF